MNTCEIMETKVGERVVWRRGMFTQRTIGLVAEIVLHEHRSSLARLDIENEDGRPSVWVPLDEVNRMERVT